MLQFNEGVSYFDVFGWLLGRRDLLVSMLPSLDPFGCRRTRTTGLGCAPPVCAQVLANYSRRKKSRPGGLSYRGIARIETRRARLQEHRSHRDQEGAPTQIYETP